MITQRTLMRHPKQSPSETWSFTVNTEASTSGGTKAAIPFNLFNQRNVVLSVDWGDGSSDLLTKDNYTSSNALASVHTYNAPGTYTISISSDKWRDAYFGMPDHGDLVTSTSNATIQRYYFQRTLIGVDTALPKNRGGMYMRTDGSWFTDDNDFKFLFSNCQYLRTVPDDLFSNNNGYNIHRCFWQCSALTGLPPNIFSTFKGLRTCDGALRNCSSLGGFELYLSSHQITNADSFVSTKSGVSRIIHVPAGTVTESTFRAVSGSLGLTIIAG